MLTLLGYVGAIYGVIVMTWVYYLAAMKLIKHRKDLRLVARIHGWLFVIIPGILYDVFLNVVIASVFFLDPPRELLLTTRLKRYKTHDAGWRKEVALWICEHLLD